MTKITEYVLYAFFIVFPFINYSTFLFGGTSTRSVNLIFLTSILGIIFAVSLFRKGTVLIIPKSPIALALCIYLISLTISAIVGISFHTSFWSVATRTTGLWYFLNLGFFMYLLWLVIRDELVQKRMILVIILSTAVYSILSLLSGEGLGLLFSSYTRDAFTFGNSTFAGTYIFAVFLLSIYYLLQSSPRKWWMYVLPIVLVINPNVISTSVFRGDLSTGIIGESRASATAIVLSIIGLAVMWLISKIKNTKRRAQVSYGLFGFSLIVMVLASISLFSPDGYLRKIYLSQATAARPLVWEIAGKSIAERPFFGWGTDNFERVFEVNYDNRLLQNEYGAEAWFDRAHNVFIDQTVDNGFVGLAAYLAIYIVVILALIYTTLHSEYKNDRLFAAILIVYFPLHLLELQTAFDTSISYPILSFMLVSAALLFERTRKGQGKATELIIPRFGRYGFAAALVLFFGWTMIAGWFPFVRAQIVNGQIRTVGDSTKRLPMYQALLASPVDQHVFLWRTSTDFQRGIIQDSNVLKDKQKFENLKKEVYVLELAYKQYISQNPTHFRAHLNLADILIYQMLFETNKLQEAQEVLDEAIDLVPQSPQAYWMKAVASIYMKKFNLARETAQQALKLNPQIVESQALVEYVERSVKNFPSIDLYFFRQI
ncbi:MAG: O-antigen ligase family protein [bacterium]|nr:O-antigen ligase family protein [bacterium]